MRKRLVRVVVPLAVVPLAVVTLSAFATGASFAPDRRAGTECVGGLCDVCPAVAKALTAVGEEIYCAA